MIRRDSNLGHFWTKAEFECATKLLWRAQETVLLVKNCHALEQSHSHVFQLHHQHSCEGIVFHPYGLWSGCCFFTSLGFLRLLSWCLMDSWNLLVPHKELVDLIRTLAMALDFCKLKKWKHESWRGRFTLCRLHQFALFLPPAPVHLKIRYHWLNAFFLGLIFKQVTWLFVFSSPRPVLSLHAHLAVCCCFSFWFRSKALRNSSPPSWWYSASSWTCGSIPALLICSYSEATCWNLSGSHQQPDTKRNQNWWPSPHLCQRFWIQSARWRRYAWSRFKCKDI